MKVVCQITDVGQLYYYIDFGGNGQIRLEKRNFKYSHKIGDMIEITIEVDK